MVFSSTTFLFLFLPLVLLLYFARQSLSWRNTVLLVASLFFYAWGEGIFVAVMLFSIGINYVTGIGLKNAVTPRRRKWLLAGALFLNLGMLVFFKNPHYLVNQFNILLTHLGLSPFYFPSIPLPIGISFFTFQAISYIVDVYRQEISAQSNPIRLGLYISLFPQLVAGPIVRYRDIQAALTERKTTLSGFSSGVQRFIIGFAKKVLIADVLGQVADQIFSTPAAELGAGASWLGLICYTFQIYYDFSGYSDMAIGLGRMFGFHFLENFTYPYISRSLREFWRRWHISLSTWFRDYLYIPLGGNRGSAARTYVNLVIVFFLCGFWHGASWNFVIWGLFHGFFLIAERTSFGGWLKRRPNWMQNLYLLLIVCIGWVWFRSNNLLYALAFLKSLAGFSTEVRYYADLFLNGEVIVTLLIAVFFAGPVFPFFERKLESYKSPLLNGIKLAGLWVLFILGLAALFANTYEPFIYFRF